METLTCPVCHLLTPTLPDGQIAAHTAGDRACSGAGRNPTALCAAWRGLVDLFDDHATTPAQLGEAAAAVFAAMDRETAVRAAEALSAVVGPQIADLWTERQPPEEA